MYVRRDLAPYGMLHLKWSRDRTIRCVAAPYENLSNEARTPTTNDQRPTTKAGATRWILVLLVAALIASADLSIWTNPRLSSEEGTYFAEWGMRDTPLFSRYWVQVGYLDLVPVLTARVGMKWVDLAHYPIFVTLIALLVHLIPVAYIAFSRAPIFNSSWIRFLSMLAFVLAVPIEAIWLSTLASKFFLATLPILVLMEGKHIQRPWTSTVLMLLASLGSIVACFLTPLVTWFLVKPGEGRSRLPLLGFSLGVLVQGTIVLSNPLAAEEAWSPQARIQGEASVVGALSTVTQTVLFPLGLIPDPGSGQESWHLLTHRLEIDPLFVVTVLALLTSVLLLWVAKSLESRMVLIALSLLVVGSWVGSLGEKSMLAGRYLIAPSVMVFLTPLWSLHKERKMSWRSFAALGLVCMTILVGATRWFNAVAADPGRPVWSEEIRRYESGDSQVIRVTPPGFVMRPVRPDSQVEYRSLASGEGLHLSISMPKLGLPLIVRILGGNPLAHGLLMVEPGRAPIEAIEGRSELVPADPSSFPARILPNPTEGPGIQLPFKLDDRGVATVELRLSDDPLYLGRTYTLQAQTTKPVPAHTEVVSLRLGR